VKRYNTLRSDPVTASPRAI